MRPAGRELALAGASSGAEAPITTDAGYEMVVGGNARGDGGKILGHRAFARYYRQKYRGGDPRRSAAVISSVLAKYASLPSLLSCAMQLLLACCAAACTCSNVPGMDKLLAWGACRVLAVVSASAEENMLMDGEEGLLTWGNEWRCCSVCQVPCAGHRHRGEGEPGGQALTARLAEALRAQ